MTPCPSVKHSEGRVFAYKKGGNLVEKDAGLGSGLSDDEYRSAGAAIVDAPEAIFARADMIVEFFLRGAGA